MISKNIIKFIHSLELKKNRRQEGLFVAEGPKVVGDMIGHYKAHMIICTEEWIGAHGNICTETDSDGRKTRIETATDEELRKVSFLQHPQQVLAVFRIPEQDGTINKIDAENNLCLALDGVQDPGNLGTIIRIADWFGITDIICSPDTADAYNPKVVQATMGSLARTNIIYTDLNAMLDKYDGKVPVYGTMLDGSSIYEKELTGNGIIIMGNEGNGISEPIRKCITQKLLIPDFHNGETADSLNVAIATAITCSEFRRRGL